MPLSLAYIAHPFFEVEVSKMSQLDDSAGGYEWSWQKEARVLQEAAENAGVGSNAGGEDSTSALKLSMDNILMVTGRGYKFSVFGSYQVYNLTLAAGPPTPTSNMSWESHAPGLAREKFPADEQLHSTLESSF